ncbi:receptor-type tyrosine-protein phosphatase beta, partial [Carassius gibelio]|uniref:receptor-type tyrosine-protein phosphatase beta n=1 Tax=Carassius gibelio TaxID=101364 RepID=UPI0022790694
MEMLFLILLTLDRFYVLSGFLIAHTNKGLCLSTQNSVVVLRKCDESNPYQQWIWTSTMRLNHTLVSRCLWVSQSTTIPKHTRLVKLRDCDTAPAWKCYNQRGIFGLAEMPMFLKKQGERAVVCSEKRYSNWSMITMDSEGRRVSKSLCPATGPSTVSTMTQFPVKQVSVISTGEMTTLTVPDITQSRAVTHLSNTARSRTKRTATTGLGHLTTFTAEANFNENYTQTLETESLYEMSDVTDVSPSSLMVKRTHVPQNFTQNRAEMTEMTSDVTEQTHNPLTSQTESAISTTDAESSVSLNVSTETQTALVFHTGPSEANSSDVDPILTESSTRSFPVSNTDGAWTNAKTKSSTTTKIIKDVQTMLPFKTRTTRAITKVLPNTDTRAVENTATSSAKTRAGATATLTALYTSTAVPHTDVFTSTTYTTTLAPATTVGTTTTTAALSTRNTPPSTITPTMASTAKFITTEAATCLVNVTAKSINMDYCVFNFTTPGKSCNFILTDDSNSTRCSEDIKRPNHYTCLMMGLTPGATYLFGIMSQKNGIRLNITVQTAPAPVTSLTLQSNGSQDSLKATWIPAVGYMDFYELSLSPSISSARDLSLPPNTTHWDFSGLRPGKAYQVLVKTKRGELTAETRTIGSSAHITGRTIPAQVTKLRVSNQGSTDALQVCWDGAAGEVDLYRVLLIHDSVVMKNESVPPNVTSYHFQGLRSGTLYRTVVTTVHRGDLSRQTVADGRTAPGSAAHLKLEALNEKTLRLSWSPPDGDWDFYRILLFNGSSLLMNRTIERNLVEFSFTNWTLIPGRLYRAAVSVESGYLSSTADCHGRLAPRSVQRLNVRHSTETSLSAVWNHPIGEWDNYTVLLKDEDTTVDTQTLAHDSQECNFNNLMPGHTYMITVMTNSGDLSSSAHITGRTIPAQVTKLRVSNQGSTDALQVCWDGAAGEVDLYRVLLIHDSVVMKNESVPPNVTSYHFQGLRSGALYRTVVTTVHRGDLSRQTVADGRTVPAAVRDVTVSNNGRMDFLSVSWRAAEGDVDSYSVTL